VSPPATKRFTIPEGIVCIGITLVLSALLISIAAVDGRRPARERALAEIKALSVALANYYTDTGEYPRNADSDALDPRLHLDAMGESKTRYERACLHLYRELSGDREPSGFPDGEPENTSKVYCSFSRYDLAVSRDGAGNVSAVRYISDPWGNCYGYSTAAIANGSPSPGAQSTLATGFNTSTFDLWSTVRDDRKKWVKNWP